MRYCPKCGADLTVFKSKKPKKSKKRGKPFVRELILQFLANHSRSEFYLRQLADKVGVSSNTITYAVRQLERREEVTVRFQRVGKSFRKYVRIAFRKCRTPSCEEETISRSGFCRRCWTHGRDYFIGDREIE